MLIEQATAVDPPVKCKFGNRRMHLSSRSTGLGWAFMLRFS